MCEAFFLAEFTKKPTGWTWKSPGFWGIRIQQTQGFTKFTIEFHLLNYIINQGLLGASLVSWIRSEFTLIPNCPPPPPSSVVTFYISSVWLFDSIFSLTGILTIPTTLPEIRKLYNIHLLKHIISRGFRWLMIESSCWPSPCCSFARHLVGKIVIHCSSAHHYAQPCKKNSPCPERQWFVSAAWCPSMAWYNHSNPPRFQRPSPTRMFLLLFFWCNGDLLTNMGLGEIKKQATHGMKEWNLEHKMI